jgi:hypothetical protein
MNNGETLTNLEALVEQAEQRAEEAEHDRYIRQQLDNWVVESRLGANRP